MLKSKYNNRKTEWSSKEFIIKENIENQLFVKTVRNFLLVIIVMQDLIYSIKIFTYFFKFTPIHN